MKRSIKTLQLISLVIVVGFGISCLSDTDAGVDLSMVPDGFTWEGKEDLFGGSCDEFHQASADITVLSAQLIGRAAPSSNTVPADYKNDTIGVHVGLWQGKRRMLIKGPQDDENRVMAATLKVGTK